MAEIEIVVAHAERTTLQVGDVFVKVDADQDRLDREVAAMTRVPVGTPRLLWHQPPALALARLPGTALGRLGQPSTASSAAWTAAGAEIRRLHSAPLPPWPGRSLAELTSRLDAACDWLLAKQVLPAELVERNRDVARVALRPWPPVFIHGDLQLDHVFVDGDEVTGILDWSEAAPGDGLYDLATVTLGHEERLPAVIAGYGSPVDVDVIRGWWSWRSLTSAPWLIEHGFDPDAPGAEFDVLRARMPAITRDR